MESIALGGATTLGLINDKAIRKLRGK